MCNKTNFSDKLHERVFTGNCRSKCFDFFFIIIKFSFEIGAAVEKDGTSVVCLVHFVLAANGSRNAGKLNLSALFGCCVLCMPFAPEATILRVQNRSDIHTFTYTVNAIVAHFH